MNEQLQSIIRQNKNIKWIATGVIGTLLIAMTISDGNWLYLGLLLLPLFAYLCIMNPFIFPFGLYVALLPTEGLPLLMLSGQGSHDGSSLLKVLGFLTAAVLLFKGMFERKLKRPDTAALWWTLVVAYGVLSILWAIQPERVIGRLPTVLGLLILYLVISSYHLRKRDFDIIKWCCVGGGVPAAIQVFLNYMQNPDMRATVAGHYDTNTTAFALLLPFAVSTSMMLGTDRAMKKAFGMIAFGFISIAILVGGSRGGLLGAATILLIHMRSMKHNLNQKIINFIIVTIAGFILVSFVPDFLAQRWETAAETGGANRLYIWYIGVKSLEKYWLFGAGMNNFPMAFNEFSYHLLFFRPMSLEPHNNYLGYLVELGLVGFALVLMAIVKHYRAMQSRSNPDEIMLKAAFWGLLVSSIFLTTYLMKSYWLLWMMILMYKNATKRN
jgi:O-antigen ligase